MGFQCMKCGRLLYNRRRAACEFCGAAVPDKLRLSATQRSIIERLKAAEAERHREFMGRSLGSSDELGDVLWIAG